MEEQEDFLEQDLFLFYLMYHSEIHDKGNTNHYILPCCRLSSAQEVHSLDAYIHRLELTILLFLLC